MCELPKTTLDSCLQCSTKGQTVRYLGNVIFIPPISMMYQFNFSLASRQWMVFLVHANSVLTEMPFNLGYVVSVGTDSHCLWQLQTAL